MIAATVVLVCGDREVASWPLSCTRRPDVGLVDRLGRLQLAARRQGCAVRLRDACPDLVELLELCGLAEVLGGRRQARRQPEGGEEPGVEEVVVPDDPVA